MSDNSLISDLISQLLNTSEAKRSQAIGEAIKFLSIQIEAVTKDNFELNQIKDDLTNKFNEQNILISQLNSDKIVVENESKLLKAKLGVMEELIHTQEMTIEELNKKINNNQDDIDNKCQKFTSILEEYKKIFEELKMEKLSMESQISKQMKENNSLKNENERLKGEIEKLKTNKKKTELLNKKLKDYELLLYKIDLENQTFKQELKNCKEKLSSNSKILLSNETDEPIEKTMGEDIPIEKINLNNELNTIDMDYNQKMVEDAINLCTETDREITEQCKTKNKIKNENNSENSSDDELNKRNIKLPNSIEISQVNNEIKQTENTLREYSNLLINKEKSNIQATSKEFKDIMSVMEYQTEKLVKLKQRYNELIKSSI